MGSVRGLDDYHSMLLDEAIGPQSSSLRPSSAKYSFPRSARLSEAEEKCRLDLPGPGEYDYSTGLTSGVSAIMGTARSAPAHTSRRHNESDYKENFDPEASVPDASKFKFHAPPRPTFGNASARERRVMDCELLRACPDHGYGDHSPGLIYTPDHDRVRPRSAPHYSMRKRPTAGGHQRQTTPAKVGPSSYPGAKDDAIGVQRDSRRRTASASSFGRASRFAVPKPAAGCVSEECKSVRSDFGDRRTGARGSGRQATFGKASRDGTSRAVRGERQVGAGLSRPKLPHPPVAPRQELLRYGDNLGKHI